MRDRGGWVARRTWSPAELFSLEAERRGHLLQRGLARLFDTLHLGVRSLRDAYAARKLGLRQPEVLSPGGQGVTPRSKDRFTTLFGTVPSVNPPFIRRNCS